MANLVTCSNCGAVVLPLESGGICPTRVLLGSRFVMGGLAGQIGTALSQAMLAVVGIVALLMLLKRAWLAALAGVVIYTPVVIEGMFSPGTPRLDIALGAGIISVLILVILRHGLLATVAALATHFILLRAPLTTDLASWRGPIGLWYVGIIAIASLAAGYVARGALPRMPKMPKSPELPGVVQSAELRRGEENERGQCFIFS